MSTFLRVLATIVCGPMLLIGCVWMLQGINVLPGSFMSGHIQWTLYGIPLVLAGAGLVYWLNKRRA